MGDRVEYRKLMQREKVDEKCVKCGDNDSRILAVHHIDKDRENNKKENLIYLCMNCHFLVHRYDEKL